MKAVDRMVGLILATEDSLTLAVLMQELRLLEAFSGECSKSGLSFRLWKITEDVESQVIAS